MENENTGGQKYDAVKGFGAYSIHDVQPFQRVLDSGRGDPVKIAVLRRLREQLNPFELSAAINKKLAVIWALASKANLRPAEKQKARKRRFWEKQPGDYELPPALFLPLRNIEMGRIRGQWIRETRFNTN